uniref:Uncharacterized protein n=1 Tax=Podoviridae sp. ctdKF3 TaxID=2825261 RepID=A0A8S5PRZ5_9CAUD|nr:MAG TPA: hypothetical protein [Podoviridae sp. ctdKF3]
MDAYKRIPLKYEPPTILASNPSRHQHTCSVMTHHE